jgi:tetratricopeptide (TPR) repeat protein
MTTDATVGGGPVAHPDVEQERWYLNDQREFLLRSIDDADREHAAGDMAKADRDVLVMRDQKRLAEVEAELAALGPVTTTAPAAPAAPDARDAPEPVSPVVADVPARRRLGPWRRVGIVAASLLIVAGAVILVNHAVNPSLPGQAPSGSITESKARLIEQELAAAAVLNNNGEAIQALQVYNRVLAQDPEDPEALAAWGWLEWNYGNAGKSPTLLAAGRRAETKAIAVAPSYYAGHLFLGLIVLNQDHDAQGAVKEFTKFLADSPPNAELVSVASLVVTGYQQANVALPPKLATALATEAAATPSTTEPSTSTTMTSTP